MTNEEIIGMVQAKFPGIYPDDKVGILLGSLNKMSPLIKFGLEEYLKNGSIIPISTCPTCRFYKSNKRIKWLDAKRKEEQQVIQQWIIQKSKGWKDLYFL